MKKQLTGMFPSAAVIILTAAFGILLSGCSRINEDGSQSESAVYIGKAQSYSESGSYVLNTLNDRERQLYDGLVAAVREFRPDYTAPFDTDRDELKKIFVLVYNCENDIFWLDSSFFLSEAKDNTVNLLYRYTEENVPLMRGELELAAGTIIGSLPEDCGEYEKVKLFHDAIVKGCSFSKDGSYSNTAYGALADGSAQCEGYAFAMSYLCDMAGINNYVVIGTTDAGASHAWNKVSVDGEWYNVDCTWDDPVLDHDDSGYIKHEYLLVTDEEIYGKTHFINEEYFTAAPCVSSSANYFIKENLMADTADDGIAKLTEGIRECVLSKSYNAEVRFTDEQAYKEAVQRLFDNKEITTVISNLNGKYGLGIKSAYKSTNDELYVIHFSAVMQPQD